MDKNNDDVGKDSDDVGKDSEDVGKDSEDVDEAKPADRSLLSSRQGGNCLKVDGQGGAHVSATNKKIVIVIVKRGTMKLMLQRGQ